MNQVMVLGSDELLKRVLKKIVYGFVFVDVPAETKATLMGFKKTGRLIKSSYFAAQTFIRSKDKKSNFMSSVSSAKATSFKM